MKYRVHRYYILRVASNIEAESVEQAINIAHEKTPIIPEQVHQQTTELDLSTEMEIAQPMMEAIVDIWENGDRDFRKSQSWEMREGKWVQNSV